jgi:hypothetical protein
MCVCTTLEHTVSLEMRKVDCMQLSPPDGPTGLQKAQSDVSFPNLKAVVITQDLVTTQLFLLVLPDPLFYLGTDLRSEFDHGTTTILDMSSSLLSITSHDAHCQNLYCREGSNLTRFRL